MLKILLFAFTAKLPRATLLLANPAKDFSLNTETGNIHERRKKQVSWKITYSQIF